jgi:hypothetical protein
MLQPALPDLMPALPEIVLAIGAMVMLMLGVFRRSDNTNLITGLSIGLLHRRAGADRSRPRRHDHERRVRDG